MMLQPKDITVKTLEGDEKVYVLSKFPAVAGREILTQYPVTAIPKVGEYAANEALMLKIMGYVGVRQPGRDEPLLLTTRALVDNHVPDWETLARIELAMIDYNTSFFRDGRASVFFAKLGAKALPKITETLTVLLENLSQAGRRPSTSSGQSTHSKTPS